MKDFIKKLKIDIQKYKQNIQIRDKNKLGFLSEKSHKKCGTREKIALPTIPKFHLPGKATTQKVLDSDEQGDET